MSAEEQTKILADYIMAEIPGEPSQSEGAGATAVRLLKKYRNALELIMFELGVPGPNYPAPASNAHAIACDVLGK